MANFWRYAANWVPVVQLVDIQLGYFVFGVSACTVLRQQVSGRPCKWIILGYAYIQEIVGRFVGLLRLARWCVGPDACYLRYGYGAGL